MDAGRGGEQLIVRRQGGGGVLEQHVPRVEARVPGEERGQLGEEAGEHPEETPLGDTAELAETDASGVERERQRFAVKVASGEDGLVIGENQRIVSAGIEFHREHPAKLVDRVVARTVYLGGAAKGISILHAV